MATSLYPTLRQNAVTPGQPERKLIRAQQPVMTEPGGPMRPAPIVPAAPKPGFLGSIRAAARPTAAAQPPRSSGFMGSIRAAAASRDTRLAPTVLPPSAGGPGGPTEPAPFRNLGQDFLKDYDTANEENIRNRYREGAQQAARFGILGSGMAQDLAEGIARDVERDRLGFAYDAHRDERDFRLRQRMSEEELRDAAFRRLLAQTEFTSRGKDQRAAFERAAQAQRNAEEGLGGASDLLARYAYEEALRRQQAGGR